MLPFGVPEGYNGSSKMMERHMNKINKWVVFLVLATVTCTGWAQSQMVKFGPRGESLPLTQLVTLTSAPDEGKEAFLARSGRFFHNYTQNNGYEACANICRSADGNRFGLVVTTNQSHVGCLVVSKCPDATPISTGQSIHSHPLAGSFQANAADELFRKVTSNNTSKLRRQSYTRVHGGDHAKFSETDRASGPGYLVADEKLMYFDGKEENVVSPLAEKVFP